MDSKTPPGDRWIERTLVAGLLALIALQTLVVALHSALGLLDHAWITQVISAAGFLAWSARQLSKASPGVRSALFAPWRSPWPWLVVVVLLVQIAVYPPMMHDSLSYRLPRMFLALQEGTISEFATPDNRMNSMPWGWESLALPFAALNLTGWSRLLNLGGWMLVYHLTVRMTAAAGAKVPRARWLGLAVSTAPFLVFQAASTANDLYAATLLLAGAWMMGTFRERPGPVPVMASLLALVLAANAKPQFLVLGLAWLAWWLLAAGAPWKRVSWIVLVVACPLYVLVSPLPQLVGNLAEHGCLLGTSSRLQPDGVSPLAMSVAGLIQFLGFQLQLPVFPGADGFSSLLRSLPGMQALGAGIPKFAPGVSLIPQIDNASFGLVHSLLLLAGVMAALRSGARSAGAWVLAVGICFLIATSQVVVSTMGRSFAGFVIVLFPVAATGFATLLAKPWFRVACLLPIAAGALSIVINPSAPLWPARATKDFASKRGMTGLERPIDRYLAYQERGRTGAGILKDVPRNDAVGILIRAGTPVAALWQPDWRRHRIDYVHKTDPADFTCSDRDWLLVADKAREYHPEAFAAYSQLSGWVEVEQREYLPLLAQGWDTWRLYFRTKGHRP